MAATSKVPMEMLVEIRDKLGDKATSVSIQAELKAIHGITLDESTIRGRFLSMGQPLGGAKADVNLGTQPVTPGNEKVLPKKFEIKSYVVPEDLKSFIPRKELFDGYVERKIDTRLAMHYEAGKVPLSQGPQGSGKTMGHSFYAHKAMLPFFLISCFDEMKLHKLYGDKTIQNGSIVFKESLFVKATQSPSVILFDEVNAIANSNTFDFHALLQNRELFVKDADGGNGKWYKLHPDCKIGFAMNPKSSKYIGGHVKPSNFLGRCTFVSYAQFDKKEIRSAIKKKYTTLTDDETTKFVEYFSALCQTIERASLPIDISIRQLNSLIDLTLVGMPLKDAINDAIVGMLDAVSQPKAKDSFLVLAAGIWPELKETK